MAHASPSNKGVFAALGRVMLALAELQVARPWLPLVVVGAITAFFGWRASHLELRLRYEQMLPESAPAVIELHRLEQRTTASQTVMIVLEGDDEKALRSMGDALVPRLVALGQDRISSAEDGIQASRSFLLPRAGLFLEKEDLEQLRHDVDVRWDYEVAKTTGALIDEDEPPPPPLDAESMKKRFEGKAKDKAGGADADKYPDGYYESKDRKALVVVAHSPIAAGDLDRIAKALDGVHAAVAETKASRPEYAAVRVTYAGDMPTGFKEYGAIKNDLLQVGVVGVSLVLGIVLLYFFRVRALLTMSVTILTGLVWTFGLTELVIGHVNIATGFLFSIVAGNGINFGIIFMSRFFEDRRAGETPGQGVLTAMAGTWQSTLVACLAASAAYASLIVTDFHAFKHFGIIGAMGMLACWVVTMLVTPPVLLLVDRRPRAKVERTDTLFGRLRTSGVEYGRFFAAIVPAAPRGWVAVGVALLAFGTAAAWAYVRRDPMEYDLSKVQNDRDTQSDLSHAWAVAEGVLGAFPNAMVVLCDSPEQAKELEGVLHERWDAAPAGAKPFAAVHTLGAFVPPQQAEKLPTLLALGERLRRAHERGLVKEEDWKKIEPVLPPEDGELEPWGLSDLPEPLARPFTERSGVRGTLVLIEPEPGPATDDLRYLMRYSGSFRETKLPSGAVVRGSGRAVIFADILSAVVSDIPKAIGVSLVMTFLTVFLTFRRGAKSVTVLGALAVGVGGLAIYLWLRDIKLNFLNFAALPITFGIGVDYAVNLMQRYHADGSKDVVSALRTTGGAITLCSLTTVLGYIALIGSHNQAIRGLGVIAVWGEITCLSAALLVLPAFWLLVERRRKEGAAAK
jgi:hypothetical protein